MPLAGGVAAPIVAPIKTVKSGERQNHIDTETYIELESETPNCSIYFTTDGSKPNPWKRMINGRESTFRYTGPFTMKAGKRTLKSMAVHKATKVESHVVTKTFYVDDYVPNGSGGEDICDDVDSDSSSDNETAVVQQRPKKSSSTPKTAWAEENVDKFLQRTADQGFSATNVSGTQINLWGGNPGMGWDIRTPGNTAFHGSFAPQQNQPLFQPEMGMVQQQQLNSIAQQLSQQINQNRFETVSELRNALKELENAKQKALPPPTAPVKGNFEPEVLSVSPGNGDVKKQVEHIYGHLLQYARENADFKAALGPAKMGKMMSAEFDEGDDSFLVTLHLAKPGGKKFVPESKKPQQPQPQPTQPPRKASLRPKPEEVPKGHSVEEKVRQAKGEKAAAIELKTEEKPPEKVESSYFETEEYVQEGTLKPAENFIVDNDCEKLRAAMKGLGTDEAAIIAIMGSRSFKQRSEIVQRYKSMLGRDLEKDFEGDLSGNFLRVCKALCLTPEDYDATELRSAMKGLGTNEDALIEIICTRTNAQIKAFRDAYKRLNPTRDLEVDIEKETSKDFKRLLITLLQMKRDESKTFDRNLAIQDAKDLYNAGEKKWGTDESKFNQILLNRSNPHLRAMFEEYEKISNKTLEEAIKSEMSGDVKNAYITFVRCIQNKPRYFALALHKSMAGLGTDDKTLLRIIITRCEIDMVQIKAAFQAEFNKGLGEWIKDDTSGDYMKILLSLTGDTNLIKK